MLWDSCCRGWKIQTKFYHHDDKGYNLTYLLCYVLSTKLSQPLPHGEKNQLSFAGDRSFCHENRVTISYGFVSLFWHLIKGELHCCGNTKGRCLLCWVCLQPHPQACQKYLWAFTSLSSLVETGLWVQILSRIDTWIGTKRQDHISLFSSENEAEKWMNLSAKEKSALRDRSLGWE